MTDSDQWKRASGARLGKAATSAKNSRAARLALELRANLKKRKAQARHRAIAEVADAPPCPADAPPSPDERSK